MKKIKILFLGFILIGMSVQAQNLYIRAGLGVAVSTTAYYTADYSYGSSGAYTITSKKQGLGTGLPFVVAAGYNLNEHFALELGIDYFYGFSNKDTYQSDNHSYDSKRHGQMLSLVPAFVLSLPLDKFKPYARLGLKVGILNSVVSTLHRVDSYPEKSTTAIETDTKTKLYGGIAIGAQAAVGTDFVLSDLISLFGEIQIDGISYAPKHGKYTEYTENGVDKMGTRSVHQNQWDYLKVIDYPNSIPDDQPSEYTKVNEHFGNVGLVLGVKVNL